MSNQPIPPAITKIAPDGNLTPRQTRRLLIEMSLRKQKPGTGSSAAFMQRRTALNPWPDLRPILKDVLWAVVGGVATRAYMPERMTKDLDILVREVDKDVVLEKLKQAGFNLVSHLAIPGYLLHSPEGIEVDVLLGDAPWLDEALQKTDRDAAGYPVVALPYLVLMKLDATRAQDWADISRMLGWASDEALDDVRRVVARYNPEDAEDLESLIFIGRKEQEVSKTKLIP